MKEKYMMNKSNNSTAISDSGAIMDMEDAYNKITTLYLSEGEGQIEHLCNDIKEEFSDPIVKKDFERKIVEMLYDHQVNKKQELSCGRGVAALNNVGVACVNIKPDI